MGTKSKQKPKKADNYFYLDESAKDYEFSDFVRVSSCPNGLIFYFGKWFPDKKKFGLSQSILLPFNVSISLEKIIGGQIKELQEMGALVVEELDKAQPKKKD